MCCSRHNMCTWPMERKRWRVRHRPIIPTESSTIMWPFYPTAHKTGKRMWHWPTLNADWISPKNGIHFSLSLVHVYFHFFAFTCLCHHGHHGSPGYHGLQGHNVHHGHRGIIVIVVIVVIMVIVVISILTCQSHISKVWKVNTTGPVWMVLYFYFIFVISHQVKRTVPVWAFLRNAEFYITGL